MMIGFNLVNIYLTILASYICVLIIIRIYTYILLYDQREGI